VLVRLLYKTRTPSYRQLAGGLVAVQASFRENEIIGDFAQAFALTAGEMTYTLAVITGATAGFQPISASGRVLCCCARLDS